VGNRAASPQLVIIGGSYKSGTSLLCATVEAAGYANPARLTNAKELGHGVAVDLYPTRECSVARSINRKLITAARAEEARMERQIACYLRDMFSCVGVCLVIKDPYMKLLAPHWIRTANRLGVKSTRLLVTQRDRESIQSSIHNSRFLRHMQHRKHRIFEHLMAPVDQSRAARLELLGSRICVVSYKAIIGSLGPTRFK